MVRFLENAVGLFISVALVIVVMLQMIDRFIFDGSLQLAWTEEIARILLVWLTFWGAVLVQAENSHIRLELLTDRLPPRWHRRAFLAIDVVVAAFLLTVACAGAVYAWHEHVVALPATGLPRSIFVLAVAVGSLLMAAHVIHGMFVPTKSVSSQPEESIP